MKRAVLGALLAAVVLTALAPACKGKAGLTNSADRALAEIEADKAEAEAAAEAEANKPQPKPEPKVNDALYVEITARTILIREKYAEDTPQIEPEIEKVYEKLGVTAADYQDFVKALVPAKASELAKKIQEKMQALANEYR
jgi:hypothetical protein